MSPNQLFFEGIQAMDRAAAVSQSTGTIPGVCDGDSISVPRITFAPCPVLQQAIAVIDPLQALNDDGVAMYRRVLQIIGQHLLNNCSLCTQ